VSDLDPRLQGLLDKQAIREAIARYCRGVDRGDAGLMSSAYHPDAIDDRGFATYTGETVGQQMVDAMRDRMVMTSHHLTTQSIEVLGSQAGAETYYLGVHVTRTPEGDRRMMTSGRYLDRLERRDDEWRIVHRQAVVDMMRFVLLDDESTPPPSSARRGPDDPSYAVLSP
jgi:ketosteroid isomerase-like protein